MNIGLTVSLNQQNGTLEMTLSECGCNVEAISIHLNGGASWLYQGYTTKNYAFNFFHLDKICSIPGCLPPTLVP